MAGYSAQSLGIATPKGGFLDNGWYNGRNYDAATQTLGDPNQIWSKSNPGAQGTQVSATVNQQTSVAAGKAPDANQQYIQQQQQQQAANPPTPASAAPPAGGATGDLSGGAGGAGGGVGAGIGGMFGGVAQSTALNLPGLYDSLSKDAGIGKMEEELQAKSVAYNDQQKKINDNPFLSEADRVGRIQKLTMDYNNTAKTTQDAIAMARQDVQTKLDLQTKQFDINSQMAQQALSEFNSLLQSGALAGASGSDIAAITRATGISSSMIQAAINSQTQKDTPTSIQTVDDGKNIYSIVMNSKTGAVISKQILSASRPTGGGSGGKLGSAEYDANLVSQMAPVIATKLNKTGQVSPGDWQTLQTAWLSKGGTRDTFITNFGQYADQNRGDFAQAYGFTNPNPMWNGSKRTANNPAPPSKLFGIF